MTGFWPEPKDILRVSMGGAGAGPPHFKRFKMFCLKCPPHFKQKGETRLFVLTSSVTHSFRIQNCIQCFIEMWDYSAFRPYRLKSSSMSSRSTRSMLNQKRIFVLSRWIFSPHIKIHAPSSYRTNLSNCNPRHHQMN